FSIMKISRSILTTVFAVAFLYIFGNTFTSIANGEGEWVISSDAENIQSFVDVPVSITDLDISGDVGDVPVRLHVSHGTLTLGVTEGLTLEGGSSGQTLEFTGSIAD